MGEGEGNGTITVLSIGEVLVFCTSRVDAGEGEGTVAGFHVGVCERWHSKTPSRRPGDLASLVGTGSRLQGGPVSCVPTGKCMRSITDRAN